MNWILALLQALATVAGAVLIYVLGQLLVKLAEPALALRALIGKIAGDFLMYANRDQRIAANEERLKIFRHHASDLHQASAAIVGYRLFSELGILPPKEDAEQAAKHLISFSNSQLAEGAQIIDYLPWKTQQEIRRLLRISDPDNPGHPPQPPKPA